MAPSAVAGVGARHAAQEDERRVVWVDAHGLVEVGDAILKVALPAIGFAALRVGDGIGRLDGNGLRAIGDRQIVRLALRVDEAPVRVGGSELVLAQLPALDNCGAASEPFVVGRLLVSEAPILVLAGQRTSACHQRCRRDQGEQVYAR